MKRAAKLAENKPEEKKIIKLDRAKDRVTKEDLMFGNVKKKKVLDMQDGDDFPDLDGDIGGKKKGPKPQTRGMNQQKAVNIGDSLAWGYGAGPQ